MRESAVSNDNGNNYVRQTGTATKCHRHEHCTAYRGACHSDKAVRVATERRGPVSRFSLTVVSRKLCNQSRRNPSFRHGPRQSDEAPKWTRSSLVFSKLSASSVHGDYAMVTAKSEDKIGYLQAECEIRLPLAPDISYVFGHEPATPEPK
jgi:hypothetical protein